MLQISLLMSDNLARILPVPAETGTCKFRLERNSNSSLLKPNIYHRQWLRLRDRNFCFLNSKVGDKQLYSISFLFHYLHEPDCLPQVTQIQIKPKPPKRNNLKPRQELNPNYSSSSHYMLCSIHRAIKKS